MVEAGKNARPDERPAANGSELSAELLHSLVHEIRNPLAPIRNASELLRTICSDEHQLRSVEIIARQVGNLTRALDDLTSALDGLQARVRLNKQVVDVSSIVDPAVQAVRPQVDALRQNLLVALPSEPVRMLCDPLRLGQVVQTLLENATRHTPEGGSIALRVSRESNQLQIEVQDDGTGIAAERLAALFNVFGQSIPPDSAAPAGLSLAISRHVLEMHGGTIEAFSDGIGRGSRFVVRLPLSTESAEPKPPEVSAARDARKIVIIDDHEDSVSTLRDVLAAAGHAVLVAHTGELGLTLAEKFKPDAVIIDIGLPGMDGFEVAKRMRENPVTASALLIALSGFSLKQFKELAAYSAFRHYLLKPASPETILAIVEGAFERASRSRR